MIVEGRCRIAGGNIRQLALHRFPAPCRKRRTVYMVPDQRPTDEFCRRAHAKPRPLDTGGGALVPGPRLGAPGMNSNSERAVWFLGNPPKKAPREGGAKGSDSLGGARSV